MTDGYSFSWREFQENLKATCKEFRKSSEFSDVTLVCGDGVQVEGHKIILSSGSDFFRTLLRGQAHHPNPLIYLRGVQSRSFLAIVDYIYHGETTVPQGDLEEFLSNAEEFGLQGLKEVAIDGEMAKFEAVEKEEEQDGHQNTDHQDGGISILESCDLEQNLISAPFISTMSFGCNQCEFFTETNAALKEHEQNMHSVFNPEDSKDAIFNQSCKLEEKLPLFCNHCDFKSVDLYQFNLHKRKGHSRSLKKRLSRRPLNSKLCCIKCDFGTRKKSELKAHIEDKHSKKSNSNRYSCIKCDLTTRKKSELKIHIEQIHNKNEIIFECNLCDFKTLKSHYLEGHKQAKHEGIKYDCNDCEYQATTRGNLNRHKQKYHPTGPTVIKS